jgi:hypothetical protein
MAFRVLEEEVLELYLVCTLSRSPCSALYYYFHGVPKSDPKQSYLALSHASSLLAHSKTAPVAGTFRHSTKAITQNITIAPLPRAIRKPIKTHRQDPTPPMQPITILANHVLQQSPFLQRHKRHMRRRRHRSQRLIPIKPQLFPLRALRPCAFGPPEVRDACRRRHPRARVHDEVFCGADEGRELCGDGGDLCGGREVFCFCDGGGGEIHCVVCWWSRAY